MTTPTRRELRSQSAAGWQPLRITKRDGSSDPSPSSSPDASRRHGLPRTPSSRGQLASSSSDESLQTAPRRTSGSYKHVATNSLVSNNIFKRTDVPSPVPSASSASNSPVPSPRKPSRHHERTGSSSSIGLGIGPIEPRKASTVGSSDENTVPPTFDISIDPHRPSGTSYKPQRKPRQSVNALPTKALVTQSSFIAPPQPSSSSASSRESSIDDDDDDLDDEEEHKPTAAQLAFAAARAATPPPPGETTPRGSPIRSALASGSLARRLTGPRAPTPPAFVKEESLGPDGDATPRRERKTVVFAADEALEDVFEFEPESRRESLASQASSEFSDNESAGSSSCEEDPADIEAMHAIQAMNQLLLADAASPPLAHAHSHPSSQALSTVTTPLSQSTSADGSDAASLNGSLSRRPLPRVPTATSPLPPSPLDNIAESSEHSSPEASRPERHRSAPPGVSASRLPVPTAAASRPTTLPPSASPASTSRSLPEIAGASPLMIDVNRMDHLADSPPRRSSSSLTLKSGRPALSRETVLASRGASPGPSESIAALPPLRPRAATVSATRLPSTQLPSPSIASDDDSPLDPKRLDALSSPLEQLMGGPKSPSSLYEEEATDASSEAEAKLSPSEALAAHREALLRKRRESRLANEEDFYKPGRPSRRRSLSQGDEPMSPMQMDDVGGTIALSPTLLDVANGVASPAMKFSESLTRDINSVADSAGRAYRLRQHKSRSIIYGSDATLEHVKAVDDLDAGRHWRRITRQSDVHLNADALRRVDTFAVLPHSQPTLGKVFVKIIDTTLDSLPMPRRQSYFRVVFSNEHTTLSNTPRQTLSSHVDLGVEFELIKDANLHFRIAFRLENEVAAPNGAALEPKPSVNGLKKLFGAKNASPTKKARPVSMSAAPSALPREPILDYLDSHRDFAVCKVTWEELRNQYPQDRCRMVRRDFTLPMMRTNGVITTPVGSVRLRTFYIPPIQDVDPESMPASLDEAHADAIIAEWQDKVHFEGSLSQLGLDCTYWRRRHFKLRGQQLLAISEVTKDIKLALDLAHVTAIEDLNRPTPPSTSTASAAPSAISVSTDDDEALTSMPCSFRLLMDDKTSVSFYADDETAKAGWVSHLERVKGRDRPVRPWIVAWKRQLAASRPPPPTGGVSPAKAKSPSSRVSPPKFEAAS